MRNQERLSKPGFSIFPTSSSVTDVLQAFMDALETGHTLERKIAFQPHPVPFDDARDLLGPQLSVGAPSRYPDALDLWHSF